jgi:hypothetical protein
VIALLDQLGVRVQEDRCLDLAGVHILILSGQHLLTYPQVFDYVPDHDSLRARVGCCCPDPLTGEGR